MFSPLHLVRNYLHGCPLNKIICFEDSQGHDRRQQRTPCRPWVFLVYFLFQKTLLAKFPEHRLAPKSHNCTVLWFLCTGGFCCGFCWCVFNVHLSPPAHHPLWNHASLDGAGGHWCLILGTENHYIPNTCISVSSNQSHIALTLKLRPAGGPQPLAGLNRPHVVSSVFHIKTCV